MALPVYVQSAGNNISASATTAAVSLTAVGVGNLLVLWISTDGSTATVSGVTGGGATWTRQQHTAPSNSGELWTGSGGTGGSVTVTATMSVSAFTFATLIECSNAAVEASSINSGSGVTTITESITPATTGDMVITGIGGDNGGSTGNGAPWTDVNGGSFSGTVFQVIDYRTGLTGGTGVSATLGNGGSGNPVGFALSLKTAGPQVIGTPTVVNSVTTTNPAASRTGVGAGNLLVAWFSNDGPNLMNITACTGGGATWSRLQTATNGNAAGDLWVGTGGTGGSITVTGTGLSDLYGVTLYELSNAAVETSSMTTFSSANVSPSGTPATTGDAVMAFIITDVFCSSTPATPWISIIGNSRQSNSSTYQVGVTGGTLQTASTFTLHAAGAGWQVFLILKTPGGGGGSTPPQQPVVVNRAAIFRASTR